MTKARFPTFIALVAIVLLGAWSLACRSDATGALQASRQAADDSPRFSDWSEPVNLGPIVNSPFADFDPFVSKDGLSLYFAAGTARGAGCGGFDIWVLQRASVNDPWGPARNLGPTINTAAREDKVALSPDGHRLYFASNRPGGLGDFDLYVSRRRDKRDDFGWEPPVNLGSAINSTASEESPVTFVEGTLYFSSNRRDPTAGGNGDFDIYASPQLVDGTFGPAVIVEELSTVFHRDRDPAIRRDGLEIIFASNRPGGSGGLDLWVATRASTADIWSAPINLGAGINTPPRPPELEQANDWSPALSFDGTTLYFASAFRAGNMSQMFDIWAATRTKLKGSESQ